MNNSLDLAKKLISIPSTRDNSLELREVLMVAKSELSEFTTEEFLYNDSPSMLFYSQSTRPEKFKIILNAHLDVVPGNSEQYSPFEKNGKLYGRGAYDMKAAGAVMITLFKDLARDLKYPLALQLVTDEEIGGFNGTKFQIEEGVKAEFVIAGENTDLKINNKAKGILWLKLKAKGIAGHGAYPWLGENALLKLQKAIIALLDHFPIPTTNTWKTTINLARVETDNETFNKIPEIATAWLDVRYTPEEGETILESIQSFLPDGITLETVVKEPSQYTPENNEYIQLLIKSFEENIDQKASLISLNGGSDVRFYEQTGVGSVCFGLTGGGHHSDDEWVEISSLNNYYKILKDFLLSI